MPDAEAPIGMFDSGAGGLSVLAEIRRLLPGERIIYFADTAYFPYGSRSREEILARSEHVVRELLARGAKLIVVACNTATSAAIGRLRDDFAVPLVGMEPALKPAADRTSRGAVALLVTPGTARGEKLAGLIDRHGRGVEVHVIEAPGLADAVEAGKVEAPETMALVRRYAAEVRARGADVLALGCTHYAFLRAAFERELGSGTAVIEPSEAVARQVARILDERKLRRQAAGGGVVEYVCSGDETAFARVRSLLIEEGAAAR